MSQSGAPGETRKLPTNWARLTIQMDIGFTQKGITELAPSWDKTALSALRKLLETTNLENIILGILKDLADASGFQDQIILDNTSIMVGR